MEFDLVENALHSLSEAMLYYNEADEDENADKYKFCVLLIEHCAELLLKEILRRNHPALIFENIDRIKDISKDDDIQTVGFHLALHRVKTLCRVSLNQYESYLNELAKTRNKVQHYRCSIDGKYFKNLMSQSFSTIEFLFLDVLQLHFEDFEGVIDSDEILFLHEDAQAYKTRKGDILKEFNQGMSIRYKIVYEKDKELMPLCPICGAQLLSINGEKGIRCKMCGKEFENYQELCDNDQSCINSNYVMRELGKRRGKLYHPICDCPECDSEAVVYLPLSDNWKCLCCNKSFEGTLYCEDCGDPVPSEISSLAMSDYDTEDYKYLCQHCDSKARESEDYMDYSID